VHKKQAAKRPKGLSTQALFRFLVNDDHPLIGIREFRSRHETGETCSYNDYISLITHRHLLSGIAKVAKEHRGASEFVAGRNTRLGWQLYCIAGITCYLSQKLAIYPRRGERVPGSFASDPD